MRFWSKGLGDRQLVIDLSRGNLTSEPNNEVIMRGIISEPVNWNYEVTLYDIDVRGILRVALTPQALLYFGKNIGGVCTFFLRKIKRDYGNKELAKKQAEEKAKKEAAAKAAEAKPI